LPNDQNPLDPSFLVATLHVKEGIAGVGWFDGNGMAEEIFVNQSPHPQKVTLTVWDPRQCLRIVIRNVENKNASAGLISVDWIRINSLGFSSRKFANTRCGEGFFFDEAFSGQPAETLWNSWRKRKFGRGRRLQTLARLVHLAWDNCPGYREFWTSKGWHPSNLESLEDVHDIPIITKDAIKSNPKGFAIDDPNLLEFATSGTSGSPFTFKYTRLLSAAHQSAIAIATSYGDPQLLPWQQKALIIRRSVRGASATGAGGSLIVNAAAILDTDLLRQLVESYRPTLLFGWPSYMANIAQSLGERYQFRIAVVGSENVLAGQIAETRKIAKVVVPTYGLSEGAGFAIGCTNCGAYAELDTHGILSLRKRPDKLFDIVGTSFWSRGTLFISYNTGDTTFGPTEPCPHCPKGAFYFEAPRGRSHDFVLDKDRKQHALAMIVGAEGIVKLLKNVELFDFVQSTPGELLFRYVTSDRTVIDEASLLAQFRRILEDTFTVSCRYDERILDLRTRIFQNQKWTILKQRDF